ncbi:hypothetical protein Pyn_37322 [Prunus yedoensis var. nudiflora]|uniref:Uncharacterized protein n=1 Tax=Prunus yedoensis var. nudiflora TaxID=2094558 RepID=A0A314ZHU8_PRUYE|nr:hypothetical protein Pyn_37322 [Prunus yedoensis var. nudiflora]
MGVDNTSRDIKGKSLFCTYCEGKRSVAHNVQGTPSKGGDSFNGIPQFTAHECHQIKAMLCDGKFQFCEKVTGTSISKCHAAG